MFGAAAVFNFGIGFGLLFARPLRAPLLHLDPIKGTNHVFVDLAGGLIALSGYAFVLLAINPDRPRP